MEHSANRGKPLAATFNAQRVLLAKFHEKTVAKNPRVNFSNKLGGEIDIT